MSPTIKLHIKNNIIQVRNTSIIMLVFMSDIFFVSGRDVLLSLSAILCFYGLNDMNI